MFKLVGDGGQGPLFPIVRVPFPVPVPVAVPCGVNKSYKSRPNLPPCTATELSLPEIHCIARYISYAKQDLGIKICTCKTICQFCCHAQG